MATAVHRRKLPGKKAVLIGCGAGVLLVAAGAGVYLARSGVRIGGLTDDAVINAAALRDAHPVTITAAGGRARAELDGRPVSVHRSGRAWALGLSRRLAEGRHRLTVSAPGRLPFTTATSDRTFTVDTTPPAFDVAPVRAASLHAPVQVGGRVDGARRLTAGGRRVPVHDGRFSVRFATPPEAVDLVATDVAGNERHRRVPVVVPHPPMRGVHMSAISWTSDALREPVMKMIRAGRINAVELDIKDESGEVGYDSRVPLARKIKAVKHYYDAREVIDRLHALGVQVVGRIVAFRDPKLATASWHDGHKDRVVRSPGGGAYNGGQYGQLSFTNFADPEVRAYNIDLAREAARLGFDDILYDYVRRPDGPMSKMRFPGLHGTPERSVAGFLRDTRRAIRPEGAFLGASLFGIAATRPEEIAQSVPEMGPYVDYVAPMVYPSHWAAGEYGVSDPDGRPYEIVRRSLADFVHQLRGTHAQVMPWLQDFSLGDAYGTSQVADQIRAAKDVGAPSFLLWDPGVRYHAGALPEKCGGCEGGTHAP